jgi:thioredoxin-related protein
MMRFFSVVILSLSVLLSACSTNMNQCPSTDTDSLRVSEQKPPIDNSWKKTILPNGKCSYSMRYDWIENNVNGCKYWTSRVKSISEISCTANPDVEYKNNLNQ